MKVDLKILEDEQHDWSFSVSFENDSDAPVTLPVDSIKRNGDRTGLRFQLDGIDIEPIDFTLISPKALPAEVQLISAQKLTIDFMGKIELKAPQIYALSFSNAVYKIVPGKTYQVRFAWHDMQSNSVEWHAS